MENDDCDQTSNPCKTVSSTDKSPGDRTQQCAATANGVASYHIQYYWAFKTIIIFFIKTLDERNGIFFSPYLYQVKIWVTKRKFSKTFHYISFTLSQQHSLLREHFRVFYFSAEQRNHSLSCPHSRLASFSYLKSLWPITTTIAPLTRVFSIAPFREQFHAVQVSMMPLWAENLSEDVGLLIPLCD